MPRSVWLLREAISHATIRHGEQHQTAAELEKLFFALHKTYVTPMPPADLLINH